MDQFKDKIAVVTGAASGIGKALCEELGRRGSVVVVTDINDKGAQQVASTIKGNGGRADAALLDVTSADNIKKIIDETVTKYGRLDYMFNNAGIGIAGEVRDLSLEHWRRVMDVNLWGVIYGTTAAYSIMVRQKFGHIVNIASLAGLIGYPTMTPYAMTKNAVIGLSTSLRAEAVDLGVKVSVVCPGYIETGIFDSAIEVNSRKEDVLANIPVKMMDVTVAAQTILHGVARNKAIIAFPFYARLLWWLSRLHSSITGSLHRKTVKVFRATRIG